jgi:hypothetical protein
MTWRDAVLMALHRLAARHQTRHISRQMLIEEELARIIEQTDSQGVTPAQTLSRILQELRDEGILYFSSSGKYLLSDAPIAVEDEDLPIDALDYALEQARLTFSDVPADSSLALQRRRVGQQRIRVLTLQNYNQHCALCDVSDSPLLVASHIVRWSDDANARGDLTNVICMCRLHDPLFENGYFSLADDLSIIVKPGIRSRTVSLILARETRFYPPNRLAPAPRFLALHRARVGL